jgi:hypothetical protein
MLKNVIDKKIVKKTILNNKINKKKFKDKDTSLVVAGKVSLAILLAEN